MFRFAPKGRKRVIRRSEKNKMAKAVIFCNNALSSQIKPYLCNNQNKSEQSNEQIH